MAIATFLQAKVRSKRQQASQPDDRSLLGLTPSDGGLVATGRTPSRLVYIYLLRAGPKKPDVLGPELHTQCCWIRAGLGLGPEHAQYYESKFTSNSFYLSKRSKGPDPAQ